MGWPRHSSVEDTKAFVAFSESEWARWPAGPLLVFAKDTGRLLGGSGLVMETAERAATGYVFARDAWGQGYATESLAAMVKLAARAEGLASVRPVPHRASSVVAGAWRNAGSSARGCFRATWCFRICRPSHSTCSRTPERSYDVHLRPSCPVLAGPSHRATRR